jgi:hypothetical protein
VVGCTGLRTWISGCAKLAPLWTLFPQAKSSSFGRTCTKSCKHLMILCCRFIMRAHCLSPFRFRVFCASQHDIGQQSDVCLQRCAEVPHNSIIGPCMYPYSFLCRQGRLFDPGHSLQGCPLSVEGARCAGPSNTVVSQYLSSLRLGAITVWFREHQRMLLAKPKALLMFLQWPDADMLPTAPEIRRMMTLLGQSVDPAALAKSFVQQIHCECEGFPN